MAKKFKVQRNANKSKVALDGSKGKVLPATSNVGSQSTHLNNLP
jgi:hypothetical protein